MQTDSKEDALLAVAAIIVLTGLEAQDHVVWEWLIFSATRQFKVQFVNQFGQREYDRIHPEAGYLQRQQLTTTGENFPVSRDDIGPLSADILFRTMAKWQKKYRSVKPSRYPSVCNVNISSQYLKSLINRVDVFNELPVKLDHIIRANIDSHSILDSACWVNLTRRLNFAEYDYYFSSISKNDAVAPLVPVTGPDTESRLHIRLRGHGQIDYKIGEIGKVGNELGSVGVMQDNRVYLMKIEPGDKLVFRADTSSLADVEELLNKVGALTLRLIKVKKNNPDGAPAL